MHSDRRTIEDLRDLAVGSGHNHMTVMVIRRIEGGDIDDIGHVGERRLTNVAARLGIVINLGHISIGGSDNHMAKVVVRREEPRDRHDIRKFRKRWARNMGPGLRAIEDLGDIAIGGGHDDVSVVIVRGEKAGNRPDAGECGQGRRAEEDTRLIVVNFVDASVGRRHNNVTRVVIGGKKRVRCSDGVEAREIGLALPLRVVEDFEDLTFGGAHQRVACLVIW